VATVTVTGVTVLNVSGRTEAPIDRVTLKAYVPGTATRPFIRPRVTDVLCPYCRQPMLERPGSEVACGSVECSTCTTSTVDRKRFTTRFRKDYGCCGVSPVNRISRCHMSVHEPIFDMSRVREADREPLERAVFDQLLRDPFVETYMFHTNAGETAFYNISMAEEIVRRGLEQGLKIQIVEIDRHNMQGIVERNGWDQAHVDETTLSTPGLAAPVRGLDGQVFYLLIDGTHRCVRAYQRGLPFFAYLLPDPAAKACCLFASPGLMPWG
jgi:hypothetical protein